MSGVGLPGQELEVGPFDSAGLDLRPILYLSRFPTLVFFAQGLGVAVARSILEAKDGDNGSMNLSFRDEVRLFYSSPRPSQLAYQVLSRYFLYLFKMQCSNYFFMFSARDGTPFLSALNFLG